MKKRLFKVELQRIIAVFAEDETEAKSLALRNESEDVEAWPPDFYFCDEATDLGDLPSNWHDKVPLNSDDYFTATVEELLDPNYVDPVYDGG